MAEAVASKPGPPPLDPDSVWTKIQQAGVTVPADVIDKLAELDLELSEGENSSLYFTVNIGRCCWCRFYIISVNDVNLVFHQSATVLNTMRT